MPGPAYLMLLPWPATATGGVNEVVLALSAELRNRGFEPFIGVISWEQQVQPGPVRGIEVVSIRLRDPRLAGFWKTAVADETVLRELVRSRGVVALNPHFLSPEFLTLGLLRGVGRLGVPLILSVHGADVLEVLAGTPWTRRLWRYVLRRADGVVAPSESLKRRVLEVAPEAKASVIHNGVDVELFGVRRVRADRGTQTILHIGKFEHKKAQDVLLRAFAKLLGWSMAVRLVLVGANGPALASTRQMIQELDLETRVALHVDVPHESVPQFFAEADVFVLPSRAEPFGLVLLEAGAAGVPVVATAVGGIPELLQHERTGLLVPPDDEGALAQALATMLSDRVGAERMANEWRSEVRAGFGWDRTADGYVRLVQSLRH